LDPTVLRVASIAAAAWISGLACACFAAFHARSLARRRSPGVTALLEQLRHAGGTDFARAELRELGAEAERAFSLANLLPRSLTRVALTSGTALAVLVLASGGGAMPTHVVGALLSFAGGAAGTLATVLFGQQAKATATAARAEWRAHLKEVERKLAAETPTLSRP
jgi:hypothetical protein